ncbi:NFX1-type zinc finger-containing protein 1 [Exophiala xenobiotica]|uniref:NFX1-type zinc finger-containing protein 1 n=1 Tax=Lithohypha guttulata TaxID=1690604 RepID=A0ABR0K5U7_9EURO|nr:NFX1-type zinc finger-containing protein 1 [Lithohypha guttulata]KAK5314876.1 NFX1-type zinc finger-containing protein 1 [Exophiala xenobiotica]
MSSGALEAQHSVSPVGEEAVASSGVGDHYFDAANASSEYTDDSDDGAVYDGDGHAEGEELGEPSGVKSRKKRRGKGKGRGEIDLGQAAVNPTPEHSAQGSDDTVQKDTISGFERQPASVAPVQVSSRPTHLDSTYTTQPAQPVQIAAVANTNVRPDLLAPSLPAVSQLDSKIREYFDQEGAEVGETLRNDTQNIRAYLLDQNLHPRTHVGDLEIRASLKLRLDHCRPNVRISAHIISQADLDLAPQFVVKDDVSPEDKAKMLKEHPGRVQEKKVITVRHHFADKVGVRFGHRAVINWQTVKLTNTLREADPSFFKANFPPELLAQATLIEEQRRAVPVLLNIFHDKDHVVTEMLAVGSPAWASELRSAVFEGKCVSVLFEAERDDECDMLIGALNTLMEVIGINQEDPLDKFHIHPTGKCTKRDKYTEREFNVNPLGEGKQLQLGYRPTFAFNSRRDYLTTMYAAAHLDFEDRLAKTEHYQAEPKELHLMPLAEQFGVEQVFYGFIDNPGAEDCALKIGDRMKISFDVTQKIKQEGRYWTAVVIESVPFTPEGKKTLMVRRAWLLGEDGQEYKFDDRSVRVVKTRKSDGTPREVRDIIGETKLIPGNQVEVHINQPIKDEKSKFNAIESLNFPPEDQPLLEYNQDLLDTLVGRCPDQLKTKDFYKVIRDKMSLQMWQDFRQHLNEMQANIFLALVHTLGQIASIQGPPGTGKTFLARALIRPFLFCNYRTLVLVVTPTNNGADDFARAFKEELESVALANPKLGYIKTRYVLRLHSQASEAAITQAHGIEEREARLQRTNKRPRPFADDLTLEVLEAAETERIMYQQYMATETTAVKNVRDKRVTDKSYSVGQMMLMLSGVIPSAQFNSGSGAHVRFRAYYRRWSLGDPLDESEEKDFGRLRHLLFVQAVQGASAIVGTTAGIGSPRLIGVVQDLVAAIVIDEAAHEREDALLPIFAARFKLDPIICLIGDKNQLAPTVLSSRVTNGFSPQLQISLMERMAKVGMPFWMLTEQSRMVPDIAKIVNVIGYKGQLTNSPSTAVAQRPFAQWFRNYASQLVGTESNAIFLNVGKSPFNVTELDAKNSRRNELHVCLAASILADWLKTDAECAVITPYSYQKELYHRLRNGMKAAGVDVSKLSVYTIDEAQGREFDYGLLCLPAHDKVGFFKDRGRIIVAASRPKHGLSILGNKRMLAKAEGKTDLVEILLSQFPPLVTYQYDVPRDPMQIAGVGKGWFTPSFVSAQQPIGPLASHVSRETALEVSKDKKPVTATGSFVVRETRHPNYRDTDTLAAATTKVN